MKKLMGVMLGATLISSTALAGDPEAGKARSIVCSACHGVAGIAVIDGYPNLAGQNEEYLIISMKAYRDKQRTNPNAALMQPQMGLLDDKDIENLAAYYSQMEP